MQLIGIGVRVMYRNHVKTMAQLRRVAKFLGSVLMAKGGIDNHLSLLNRKFSAESNLNILSCD